MLRLAMELPASKLREWAPLADLDFILAHKVLEDQAYAAFFKNRPKGRELILDNSLHELGTPLPLSDLAAAAKEVNADYIITPDRVGDLQFNVSSYHEARDYFDDVQKLAVVMTGTTNGTVQERENFLHAVSTADMLCCTFKEPKRLAWYIASAKAKAWDRVHLLGVDGLSELSAWAAMLMYQSVVNEYELDKPHIHASVDTGKAFKRAYQYEKLDECQSIRRSKLHSKMLLDVEDITSKHEELFRHNVKVLRQHLVVE